ncbi:NAD(P)/FAD-dependent oxidoreductase [Frigidibacter sp. MR17.24]|uniref:NAD(P)/FAD-dependent oxidoreductase n=1 Tax=Frigidibacter sp. MR17.24 TaxID=3127345 RepID=UPI003012FB1F
MPFEYPTVAPRRIAIIGGGISGMAAAHLLAGTERVTLIEAAPRLGGHARTVMAGRRGDQPVDTGFIVFNRVNYPRLTQLFHELDVPVADSDMSFGASIGGGRFEYGLRNAAALFAQKRRAGDPRFWRMLRDIVHFNRNGLAAADDPDLTVGGLLRRLGTGRWFRDYYLTPISGAIWSTPVAGMLDFPARPMLRFFANHALMSVSGQHQWLTVKGGSREYVSRLEASLLARGVEIRRGSPVAAVRRPDDLAGPELRMDGGAWERFDAVILACHADQALALLADPSEGERAGLGAVRYQPNRAVLHADASVMPRRRAAWASWVYAEPPGARSDRIQLTYWMNSLQPIPADDPLFVTLNGGAIRDELVHDETVFHHPVYDLAALAGRERIRALNGTRATWYCGAWMHDGFHEDGFASAEDVALAIARPKAMAAA